MAQIKSHPWFLTNLPVEFMDEGTMSYQEPDQPMQNMDEIMQILAEATIPAAGTRGPPQPLSDTPETMDEDMEDLDSDMDQDLKQWRGSVCHVIMSMLSVWKPISAAALLVNQSIEFLMIWISSSLTSGLCVQAMAQVISLVHTRMYAVQRF